MGLFDGVGRRHAVVDRRRGPPARRPRRAGGGRRGHVGRRWRRWSTASPPSTRRCGSAASSSTRSGSAGHEVQLREALAPVGVPVLGALRPRRPPDLARPAPRPRPRRRAARPTVTEALDRLAAAVAEQIDLEAWSAPGRHPPRRCPSVPGPAAHRAQGGCGRKHGPGRGGGGAGVHLHLYRHPRRPGGGGGRAGAVRPAAGRGAPRGGGRAHRRRRLPRGLRRRPGRQPADARRRPAPDRSRPAHLGRVRRPAVAVPTPRRAGHGRRRAGRRRDDGRLTLGYRRRTVSTTSPIGAPGAVVRGHEFHYSTVDPAGDALLIPQPLRRTARRLRHTHPAGHLPPPPPRRRPRTGRSLRGHMCRPGNPGWQADRHGFLRLRPHPHGGQTARRAARLHGRAASTRPRPSTRSRWRRPATPTPTRRSSRS